MLSRDCLCTNGGRHEGRHLAYVTTCKTAKSMVKPFMILCPFSVARHAPTVPAGSVSSPSRDSAQIRRRAEQQLDPDFDQSGGTVNSTRRGVLWLFSCCALGSVRIVIFSARKFLNVQASLTAIYWLCFVSYVTTRSVFFAVLKTQNLRQQILF